MYIIVYCYYDILRLLFPILTIITLVIVIIIIIIVIVHHVYFRNEQRPPFPSHLCWIFLDPLRPPKRPRLSASLVVTRFETIRAGWIDLP